MLPESDGGGARGGTGGKSQPECTVDGDCPVVDLCAPPVCAPSANGRSARCEARPVDCSDGDVCTFDRCDPGSGLCEHVAPADLDQDGFLGVAEAGAPSACGG